MASQDNGLCTTVTSAEVAAAEDLPIRLPSSVQSNPKVEEIISDLRAAVQELYRIQFHLNGPQIAFPAIEDAVRAEDNLLTLTITKFREAGFSLPTAFKDTEDKRSSLTQLFAKYGYAFSSSVMPLKAGEFGVSVTLFKLEPRVLLCDPTKVDMAEVGLRSTNTPRAPVYFVADESISPYDIAVTHVRSNGSDIIPAATDVLGDRQVTFLFPRAIRTVANALHVGVDNERQTIVRQELAHHVFSHHVPDTKRNKLPVRSPFRQRISTKRLAFMKT